MTLLPKGSKIYSDILKQTYIKLEDSEWSWWALQNDNLPVDKQMQVRLTDDDVIKNGYLTFKLI